MIRDQQGNTMCIQLTPRITKIKIKLGSKLASAIAKRGAVDRKKQLYSAALDRACRNKDVLGDYPCPSASFDAIVQVLRDGGPASQSFQSWEESRMAIPPGKLPLLLLRSNIADAAREEHTRKRPLDHEQPSRDGPRVSCHEEAPSAERSLRTSPELVAPSACLDSIEHVLEAVPFSRKRKVEPDALDIGDGASRQKKTRSSAPVCGDDFHLDQEQRPVSCSSDQTTNIGFHLPASPSCQGAEFLPSCSVREVPVISTNQLLASRHPGAAEQAPPQNTAQLQQQLNAAAASQQHDAAQQQRPSSTAAEPPPRPSVACQAGFGVILPAACMAPPAAFSAVAASLRSLSPPELQPPMANRRKRVPAELVDDALINSVVSRARDLKHAADRERGSKTAPWTLKALCMQVASAVLFMEACEYVLVGAGVVDRSARVASLSRSTATLLSYTLDASEAARGSDLGREALRLLSERLCAVCHMREAVHSQTRIADSANRALQLSGKLGLAQRHPAARQGGGDGVVDGRHTGQPSPNGSTCSQGAAFASPPHRSSAVPAAAGRAALAPVSPGPENMLRILEQAKQVARFSSLVRRSTLGFQSFVERADFRKSEAAKRASVHIAVVSMDFGLADSFSMLAHADAACACIASMC